jgi:hypothetical protein
MAAIAANDNSNDNSNNNNSSSSSRSWFVSLIRRGASELEILSFEALKEHVLLEYLWLPTTNDGDGNDLWDEVGRVRPIDPFAMQYIPCRTDELR